MSDTRFKVIVWLGAIVFAALFWGFVVLGILYWAVRPEAVP